MLSIILYGRNDNFGYNYHKRVALSLNAFAEQLDGADDEIIFVDYNTPDAFPTLPEAIADTLTASAKAKLRILRVRPHVHRRHAVGSHLDVIEPIARNVGLRHSNPRNRWILSSNADNVLISRTGQSLSSICALLPAGLYGLPRFEVPEALWELADRANPKAAAARFNSWASLANLDEVVHGIKEVGFDNPGDFQLAQRTDLFDIDGFDEQMTLGWHVDHNLAKRLGFRYGAPRSLASRLKMYHCSHTRQRTATHHSARTQNDPVRFVHALVEAELPRQRDAWGCPSDPIEEIRLDRDNGFGSVIAGLFKDRKPLRDATFTAGSYGNFHYSADHVATFVLNVLSTYGPHSVIGYAGVRRDTYRHVRDGLAALGFTHRILVPEEFAVRLDLQEDPHVQFVDRDFFARRSDVLVFEFGAIRDEAGEARDAKTALSLSEDEQAALEQVYGLFVAATDRERELVSGHGAAPRQFITVNAVHNRYQSLVEKVLSASASPFTTRLRHGFVSVKMARATASVGDGEVTDSIFEILGQTIGRTYPVSVQELSSACGMISTCLQQGGAVPETERVSFAAAAPLVLAYLEHPSAKSIFSDADIRTARDRFSALLAPQTDLAPDLPYAETRSRPSERPIGTLASSRDWDDEAWLRWAREFVDHNDPAAASARNGWVWERAQFAFALDREKRLSPETKALIVGHLPDPLIAFLSLRVGALDIVHAGDLFGTGGAATTVDHWMSGARYDAARVRVTTLSEAQSGGRRYDVVVVPHAAGFSQRVPGLMTLLEKLDPVLTDGAGIMIAGDVTLTGRLAEFRPTIRMAGIEGLGRVLKDHTGMRLTGDAFDAALVRSDLRLVGDEQQVAAGAPSLGTRQPDDVLWPCIWSITRDRPTRDWQAAQKALQKLYLGDQLPMLRLGPASEVLDRKIVGREGQEGTVFFGPYLVLPKGRYRVEILAKPASGERTSRNCLIRTEIVLGPDVLTASEIQVGPRPERLTMDFNAEPSSPDQLFEIRCWTEGSSRVLFEKVDLIAT